MDNFFWNYSIVAGAHMTRRQRYDACPTLLLGISSCIGDVIKRKSESEQKMYHILHILVNCLRAGGGGGGGKMNN